MIRLGKGFFLDPGPDGWTLFEVTGKERTTRRFGPFTSVRHVLQQRQVKLPKDVKVELHALEDAASSGDEAQKEMPGEPSESRAATRDGHGRTRPTSPEDHDRDEPRA